MFALSMYEEYLFDILEGKRDCDVRLYPTNKRGKIALLKSKTNLIYGYVEFIEVEQISYDEYIYWHIGKVYSLEDAIQSIEYNNSLGQRKLKIAYKYKFINPILFNIPKKIAILNKTGSWIEFDENQVQDGCLQQKFF